MFYMLRNKGQQKEKKAEKKGKKEKKGEKNPNTVLGNCSKELGLFWKREGPK